MGKHTPFSNGGYFRWLSKRINTPRDANYRELLRIMFSVEFPWVVGNDENRVDDGRNLRREYLAERSLEYNIFEERVSFLEVLIGIAERVAFLVDEDPRDWAWELIKNLKLGGFNSPLNQKEVRKVWDILDRVIWRSYNPDGSGGFFPLTRPMNDQRQVEIWYQMTAYIEENRLSFGL